MKNAMMTPASVSKGRKMKGDKNMTKAGKPRLSAPGKMAEKAVKQAKG